MKNFMEYLALKGYFSSSSPGGVTIRNQNKTITENGSYKPDSGYTGLGTVTVDVQASGGGAILPFGPDLNYTVFSSGTFTFNGDFTDNLNVTVTHGLGFVPHGALLINESHRSNIVNTTNNIMILDYIGSFAFTCCKKTNGNYQAMASVNTISSCTGLGNSNPGIFWANENTITFGTPEIYSIGVSHTKFLQPGNTYSWVVW